MTACVVCVDDQRRRRYVSAAGVADFALRVHPPALALLRKSLTYPAATLPLRTNNRSCPVNGLALLSSVRFCS